jgi:tetratricopeptide (TPR) repeat protein
MKTRFPWWLAALRLAYVAVQTRTDPWFLYPAGGDPADTLSWARELLSGAGVREGAFYGPPLYPYLLSGFLRLFGTNFGLLYYLQHLLTVGAAGLLALVGRRAAGDLAGLAAGALVLLYGPGLFFASRPVAEPLGIFLMALALFTVTRASRGAAGVGGWIAGAAALARPTMLPLAPLWAAGHARRAPGRALLLLLGFALAILPTTWRNYRASGHVVPVAANAGVTFFHGNGPGATGYIHVPAELWVGGGKTDQRRIATALARERSGLALDDVEADRWWGRQALDERARNPWGTAGLLLRRVLLTLGSLEAGLDMGPRQDPNPLRWAAPLPLAVVLGLAAAGVARAGWRATGGWPVWAAVLACAITPLAFYVTSRYRFPMVAMLCLPAGAGLAALVRPPARARPAWVGWLVGGVVAAGSLLVPAGEVKARSDAAGLRQRAGAWRQVGDLQQAEVDLRRSLELLPASPHAWVQLGEVFEASGRAGEAEHCYRRSLGLQAGYPPAACSLGQLLRWEGRDAEAVPILRRGIESNAFLAPCWNHLVGALTALGRLEEAWGEAERAAGVGVELDPSVLQRLRQAGAADEDGGDGVRGGVRGPGAGEE